VTNFRGRFNKIEGTFDREGNVLDVNVDPASVDTANAKRDEHLRSPDYLSVKEFPKLSFKGKSFTKKSENIWEVKGDLSFHGQTKEITVQVEKTGEGKGMQGGTIAGIESTFTVKRSEYGMNFMPQALSDEITITIGAEGAAK
jgi:polyisoprenoid-binding protein YceI